MITRWTKEQVESFIEWHEQRIQELYSNDEQLLNELRRARQTFLVRVIPQS